MALDEEIAASYGPPVDQLLNLGEEYARKTRWPDYLQLGFTREHLPELLRLAADPRFNSLESNNPAVWAPLHAWRTLGQLHAEEAIEPLVDLLWMADDDDWAQSDLPLVLALIGPAAIPALSRYLENRSNGVFPRMAAANGLGEIGKRHPGAREACVAAVTQVLEREDHSEICGSLVGVLAYDLHAVEALPAIRKAFARGVVDPSIAGDLQDVEIKLGVRSERSGPPRYADLAERFGLVDAVPRAPVDWSRVGRNELCPCGSGVKFKKRCLRRVQSGQLR